MGREISQTVGMVLEEYGIDAAAGAVDRLAGYLELVIQWNRKMRLVGSADVETLARRHVGESLYLGRLIDLSSQRVVDVGSGAGFPGMALQLAWPKVDVTLVEVNAKKVAFLKTVTRKFGLGRVVMGRLEEVNEVGDLVTARALERMEDEGPVRFARLMSEGGSGVFWISEGTALRWERDVAGWEWPVKALLPESGRRMVVVGRPVRRGEG